MHTIRRSWTAAVLATMGLWCAGCGDQVAREQAFSNVRIPNVSREQALQAAQLAFRQYFPIDRVDEAEGVFYSRPTEVVEKGRPERVRDLLTQTPNRRRQVAEVRVAPRGNDVIASCRVQVQRLDTSERRAFVPQTGDDRPSVNTPFSTEAGASAPQREDWVDVGRNRDLEQQVLDSIVSRLTTPAATQPGFSQ